MYNKTELKATRKCPLCDEYYDGKQNAPMLLPCNHNVCKYCLATAQLDSNFIKCALCCSGFPSDTPFELNTRILSVIRRISNITEATLDSFDNMNMNVTSPNKELKECRRSSMQPAKNSPSIMQKIESYPPKLSMRIFTVEQERTSMKQGAYNAYIPVQKYGMASFMCNRQNENSAWSYRSPYSPVKLQLKPLMCNKYELPEDHPSKCSYSSCKKPRISKD